MKGLNVGLVLVVGLGCVLGMGLAWAEQPKAPADKALPRAERPKASGAKASPRAKRPKAPAAKAPAAKAPAAKAPASPPPAEPAKATGDEAPPPAEPAKAAGDEAPPPAERPRAAGDETLPSAEQPKGAGGVLPQAEMTPWDDGVTQEHRREAARAFAEANRDLDDSLPAKAVEKYRAALKLWPHPAIHYNLALALIELRQPVDVAHHLEKAIEHGLKGLNNQADKLEQAKKYLEIVKEQIANVEVSCQKDGAKVSVDGKHVFTVEKGKPNIYKGRVAIGKHTFVAEKPGFATPVDAPFIGPRETFRIELKLYTAEELTRWKRRWPARRWMPWVAIGGGALVGLVGGGLQLSATSSYRQFNTELRRCSDDVGGRTCDAGGFTNLRDSGDLKHTLGTVGYAVAGAALVTGGLLFYLNRRVSYLITTDEYRMEELRKTQKTQKTQQTKSISLAPLVGPGMGGAVVMGRL